MNYIAFYEKSGVSACTASAVPQGASPTKSLPTGFIQSAHFISNQFYSQVTGRYNPSAYGLSPADQGTQFDDLLAEYKGVLPNSGCAGFQTYLEYLGSGVFCIRCCKYAFSYYCNPSYDTVGCYNGIPGDYDSPGFTNNGVPAVTGSAPSTFGSAPIPIRTLVPDWLACAPATDTCSPGFTCCQSPAAAAAKNGVTSCRATGYCANPQGPNPYSVVNPPTPSNNVAEWNNCTPGVSVCPGGYMCCIAPNSADISSNKATCRLAGLAANSPGGCYVPTTTSTTPGPRQTDPSGQSKCGPANSNYVCGASAPYCSQYGWCGSTSAHTVNGLSAFNYQSPPTPPSGPARPDWSDCNAQADRCVSVGFTCCVAPADVGSGKTTCRAAGYCSTTIAPPGGLRINDWNDCRIGVDTCVTSAFRCCVAPADVASAKSTCRTPSLCS